jgi:hypothetical protein
MQQMTHPRSIDTSIQLASMRQIHRAIEHIERGDYECAITLAGAAEGMLPKTNDPTFRHKIGEMAKALPKDEQIPDGQKALWQPNDFINWLKHGEVNGERYDSATIPDDEWMTTVYRAINKFAKFYELTPQIEACCKSMRDALLREKKMA